MDLATFFTKVYRPFHPRMRSQQSVECFITQMNSFRKFCRWKSIDYTTAALTEENIVAYATWQTADLGLSPFTCNSRLRTLRALWREAYKREHTKLKPEVHLLKEPQLMPEAWFPEDMEKLLQSAARQEGKVGPVPAGIWWCALILTVYWSGSRVGAAMGIRSRDTDLKQGTIRLHHGTQKTYRDELRDIPPDLCLLLERFDKDRNELLFGDWPHDSWENRRIKKGWETLNKYYHKIVEGAGLPSTGKDKWHKLRRTFGTRVAAKAGKAVAQELLGHQQIVTTQRYLDPRQMPRHRAPMIIDGPTISPLLLGPDAKPDPSNVVRDEFSHEVTQDEVVDSEAMVDEFREFLRSKREGGAK